MKILYAITKANWGGAQRYVFDLSTNLPKDKFEAVVVFGEGEILETKFADAGIRTIKIESLKRDIGITEDIASFFNFLRILKSEKPDLIHLNSSKMGGIGALAGRIYNLFFRPKNTKPVKIIFTGHGWAFNEKRSWLSKKIVSFAHWATLILAHRTIAVSEKTRADLVNLPFVSKKIAVIKNGIGNISFKAREESRSYLSEINKDKIWIGTISELHKNKGLDIAIEAFSKITEFDNNVIFTIIGGGEERAALEKSIMGKKLQEKVLLLGNIENANQYLPAFDIFTLTSRTEAFPYALLEAGKAGLPVIASSTGGIPEIITSLKTGILTRPENIKDICTAMRYFLEKPERSIEMGLELKKQVEKNFTLEKMLKKTIALYS